MEKHIMNILFFIAICFVLYLIFRNLNSREGLTTQHSSPASTPSSTSKAPASSSNTSSTSTTSSGSSNGIASNSANYASAIKSQAIKLQDVLLVSNYQQNYENSIIALDDLVNNLMLQTALSVNASSPTQTLTQLVALNEAKSALNNVMKFIDSTA